MIVGGAPLLLAVSATPYFDAVSADSPLAYYRHKETSGTTIDNEGSIGSAIDGTTSGTPTLAQDSLILDAGDTSILFDGNDDYYLTPTNSTLGNTSTANRVLECWLQFTTTLATKIPVVLRESIKTDSTGEYIVLAVNLAGTGQITARSGAVNINSSTTTFNDGNPHYVVVEKLGTTINLYVDDVLEGTGTGGSLTGTNPLKLAVGNNYSNAPAAGQYFPGYADEVAVYETLSASRRTAHYNAGI